MVLYERNIGIIFLYEIKSPSVFPTIGGALSVEIPAKFDNFSYHGIKRIQQTHPLVRPFIDSIAAISSVTTKFMSTSRINTAS